MAERNLFIERLAGDRDWYRFHALFRAAAFDTLRRNEPGAEEEILSRAASWCAANRRTEEAISYLLRLGQHERAAELVLASARWMIDVGHLPQMVTWIQSLPAGVTEGEPLFALLQAWSLFHMRQVAAAELALEHCTATDPSSARAVLGIDIATMIPVLRAGLTITRGDFLGARTAAETILTTQALVPFPAGTLRNILGYALYQLGELSAARQQFDQAATLHRACGCWFGVVYALCMHGMVDLADADLAAAETAFDSARQLAIQRCGSRSPATAMAAVLCCATRVERGRVIEERELLDLALREVEMCGHSEALALGATALAHLLLTEGYGAQALGLLQNVSIVFRDEGMVGLHDRIAVERARALLHLGRADEAAAVEAQLAHTPLLQALLRAEIALLRGERDVAARLLASARETCCQAVPARLRLELDRAAMRATGSNEQWKAFRQQLQASGWARIADAAFGRLDDDASVAEPGAVASILSDRELAVLRLMAEGRTNPAIGKALGIGLNTVKYHTNNVFQKLQVTNRTSAVMVALDRGLLDA